MESSRNIRKCGSIPATKNDCGHASLTTTERYLGVRQDLDDAPCDYLKLNLAAESK